MSTIYFWWWHLFSVKLLQSWIERRRGWWARIRRSRWGFHASETPFHVARTPFHWNHRCFKRSNGVDEHSPRLRHQETNLFREPLRIPTGFWIRERITLKFSTICSSLFLIRKSGFSIACSRNCSSGFILSLYYHILLRGEEKEEEIVEINGSICVRFDTCQPQGSSGLSRNCSGLNWGLWDGLLTSHWGTGCCR